MTERVNTHPDALRELAQYDARRNWNGVDYMASTNWPEDHGVEHHEEARDARVAAALEAALEAMVQGTAEHVRESARVKILNALAEVKR